LTFIPVAPVLQAENAWWRTPKTDIQALMVRNLPNGARVVFIPADFDRQYANGNNPDHGILLSNAVRWAAKDDLPLAVEGPGYMDCNLYQQQGRMVLHVANLTYTTFRAPLDEFVPVGPFKAYIHKNDLPINHYYAAYPEATTKDVLAALAVRDRFIQLRELARTSTDAEEFRRAFHTFLTDVQHHL